MEIPGVNKDTKIPGVDNSTEETTKNIMSGNPPELIPTDKNNTPKVEDPETVKITQENFLIINDSYKNK